MLLMYHARMRLSACRCVRQSVSVLRWLGECPEDRTQVISKKVGDTLYITVSAMRAAKSRKRS